MKQQNQLLTILLSCLFIGMLQQGKAQKADSLRYEHGYIHFHEYGSASATPVIILTGGPGNNYKQLEGLAESISSDFRSILLEQRGTGKSLPTPLDSKTININAAVKDIKMVMDSLAIEESVILGHSWGGMLAMKFASDHPDRVKHLVLVAPGPHKEPQKGFNVIDTNGKHTRSSEEQGRIEELRSLIMQKKADGSQMAEFVRLMRKAYVFASPMPDSLFNKINTGSNLTTQNLLFTEILKNFDVSESIQSYKGGIDIITGRQDIIGFLSYEIKLDIPRADLHWINESGHFPMYEQPDNFYVILNKVLREAKM